MTVPRYIWKVIVVLPEGDNDLSRINKNTRVIAVNIINRDDVSNLHWGDFRVKVNDIEDETGLNLFTGLSTATQNSLEAKLDDGPVN